MLNNSTIKILARRKTLSHVLTDLTQFATHKFHIIEAPPGTGKTYAAVHKLTQLAPNKRLLYLIDTIAGRNGIEKDYENFIASYEEIQSYDKKACEKFFEELEVKERYDSIAVVMTYAKFGYLMREGEIDLSQFGVVVCDEMQSLMNFMSWDYARAKKAFPQCQDRHFDKGLPYLCLSYAAFDGIVRTYRNTENGIYVIAITATPTSVKNKINDYYDVELSEELEAYKNTSTQEYTSIDDIPFLISKEGKTLIYMQSIEQMKRLRDKLNVNEKKCECLWSPNSGKELSPQQEKVRKLLTVKKRLPKKCKVLIINYAYYSSINIEDEEIDTVIIHTKTKDIRTQARGRVRHDIENLYLFNPDALILKDVPVEFLDRLLSQKDKNALRDYFNIKELNGRVKGFPYIAKHLPSYKYEVIQNKRKTIIKKKK